MVTLEAKFGRDVSVKWDTKKDVNEKTAHPSLFSQMRTEIPETFPAGINVI